jgi:hypothetical protein
VTVQVKGAVELAELLKQLPEKAALKASRTGLSKSAARLRTYIRRSVPRKSGKLRAAIRSAVARKSPTAFVKLGKIKGESKIRFYYKTLEYGRKAYARKKVLGIWGGGNYAASPQMATHFFNYAFARHRSEISQMVVVETRKAIFKESARLATRMRAPLKVMGGGQ